MIRQHHFSASEQSKGEYQTENKKRHELDDDTLNMVVGGIGASSLYEETTSEPTAEAQIRGLRGGMILRMSYNGTCCSDEDAAKFTVHSFSMSKPLFNIQCRKCKALTAMTYTDYDRYRL